MRNTSACTYCLLIWAEMISFLEKKKKKPCLGAHVLFVKVCSSLNGQLKHMPWKYIWLAMGVAQLVGCFLAP